MPEFLRVDGAGPDAFSLYMQRFQISREERALAYMLGLSNVHPAAYWRCNWYTLANAILNAFVLSMPGL